MRRPTPTARYRLPVSLLGVALLFVSLASMATTQAERRALIGIKLFRATLAADLAIDEKVDSVGDLVLVLLYEDQRARAERLAAKLQRGGAIRDLPIRVVMKADPALGALERTPPAGIFLAEPLDDMAFAHLMRFARRHRVLVYSPFEGDVERGVPAGLFIAARVQPYVNLKSLEQSRIQLKGFFMRAAKQHR